MLQDTFVTSQVLSRRIDLDGRDSGVKYRESLGILTDGTGQRTRNGREKAIRREIKIKIANSESQSSR